MHNHDHILAICDRCGFKYRLSQLRREWTNLMVCHGPETNGCWEPRHPQEYIRAPGPDRAPYEKRPVGVINYLSVNEVTADSL